MVLLKALEKLILALAIVGLIAGAAGASAPLMAAPSSMSMADDMPCCPDQAKSDCLTTCPLMVMCLGITLPAKPATFSPIRMDGASSLLASLDDHLVDGLGASPPRKPPRI